jgi:SHS2 domain-containing protein
MNTSKTGRWEHFSHGADVGIRGRGDTIETAFAQAAVAMTAAICDVTTVKAEMPKQIQCEAPDHELLLVDWLNALVYTMAVDAMLFSRFDIRIENTALQATAWGEPVDQARHQPAVEVKGATYTALRVAREQNGEWIAQCVIDV